MEERGERKDGPAPAASAPLPLPPPSPPAAPATARYADVGVPSGARAIFTYLVPDSLRGRIRPGHRVAIPFGRRQTHGYVLRLHDGPAPDRLRAIGEPDPPEPVLDEDLLDLVRWVSDYYVAPIGEVLEAAAPRGAIATRPRRKRKKDAAAAEAAAAAAAPAGAGEPGAEAEATPDPATGDAQVEAAPSLDPEQEEAFVRLREELRARRFSVHLLHGVPGSGKTEIYLALAAEALREGGSVLWLEPEIGLATQVLERARRRFGDLVGLFHSQAGLRPRRDTRERAQRGETRILIGARSAVFVPLPDLRLVVIDEEQEPAYKQEESPRYHGRDVAILRARSAGALAVLGSATPSLEAWWNAQSGKFHRHLLLRRHEDRPAPRVHVVDLRVDPGIAPGVRSIPLFSGLLVQKIRERLAAGEQTILFLNRRGHSTSVQCTDCGDMFRCSRCDVVLTYHRTTADLRCHHCGLVRGIPRECGSCKGTHLFFGGVGTQKLEERVAALFPHARILRLDADATRRAGSHARHIQAIESGDVDILIGTQMLAKGLHFPRVTLVGVLLADREMELPEMRAQERAYQILTQVAGRSGRGTIPGEVIFQTLLPDHLLLRCAAEGDYEAFAREELRNREALGYPPYSRMVHLLLDGRVEETVRRRAQEVALALARPARRAGVEILGPAPMFLARLQGRYRWHLTLKGEGSGSLHRLARQALELPRSPGTGGVRILVDVDPVRTL
ncbi:MAG: primosomal protein N' [Candidatus Eisenbacteria bacterium]